MTRRAHFIGALFVALVVLPAIECAAESVATPALTVPDDQLEAEFDELAEDLATSPDDARTWRDLAVVHTRLGRYQEALDAFDRSREAWGDDTFWIGYRALCAEMLGDLDLAEQLYDRLGEQTKRDKGELRARTRIAKLRRLYPASPAEAPQGADVTVAVLDPEPLGNSAPDFGTRLVGVLNRGLTKGVGLRVVNAGDVERILVRDGRELADLHHEQRADLAGALLHEKGIDALLVVRYFQESPTAETRYRVALLPTSTDGLSDPVSIDTPVGAAGAALLPLRGMITAVGETLGIPRETSRAAVEIPATLDAFERFDDLLPALHDDESLEAALAILATLTADERGGLSDAELESMRDLGDELKSPLVAGSGIPDSVVELLRKRAKAIYWEEHGDQFEG